MLEEGNLQEEETLTSLSGLGELGFTGSYL
jgi:hypothetical protein